MNQFYGGGYGPSYGQGAAGPWWGPGYGPNVTTLPTDEDIENMVLNNIDNDPLVPFDADITATSDAGEVRLTGTVPSKRAKHAAGDDAFWVPGVTDVHNELKIQARPRGGGAPTGGGA
jgi:hypothetical protein